MTEGRPPGDGRTRLIRGLAWFMAVSAVLFGLVTVGFGVVSPDQRIHAVHNAVVASLLLILSAPPVIAVARRPDRALRPLVILAAVGVAGIATMLLSLSLDPFTLPFVILIGVLWAILPSRRGAVPSERPSLPMAIVVVALALGLVPYALDQAALQRTDGGSEHARFFHWVEASFYAVAIVLLAALGAWKPSGFRMAAWLAGSALAVLGAASVLLPDFPSALTSVLAWAALVLGLAFVALAEFEARKRSSQRPALRAAA